MLSKKIAKAFTSVLTSAMLIATMLTSLVPVQVNAYNVDLSQHKTYSVDYFNSAFSHGYLVNNPAISHGSGITGNPRDTGWVGYEAWFLNNTSKNPNIYVDYGSAAVYDGKSYDVRMYTWLDHAYDGDFYYSVYANHFGVSTMTNPGGSPGQANAVHMELHFYERGYAGVASKEVSWSGITRLDDLDKNEGYVLNHYSCNGVYVYPTTTITNSGSYYYGTVGVNAENPEGTNAETNGAIWVELGGSPSNPIVLQYKTSGTFGTEIGYSGNPVNYNLVGTVPAGVTNWSNTRAASYSNIDLLGTPNCNNTYTNTHYTFSGWYDNPNFTGSPITSTRMQTSAVNVYGRYVKTAYDVTTSKEGQGTISGNAVVNSGGNHTVTWTPATGWYISQILVDGTSVSPANYSGSYTLSNITQDHTVHVVFAEGKKITTNITHGVISDNIIGIVPGSARTVFYTANSGYFVQSVTVDGTPVDVTTYDNSYTFNNITTNHTVDVVCAPLYRIDTEITNGTIDDCVTNIYPGNPASVYYTPDEGYYISKVLVDGVEISASNYSNNYYFTNVNQNHTVSVICAPYLGVTTSVTNGSITEGTSDLVAGDDYTISYNPNYGYYLESITVDGRDVSILDFVQNYAFNNISENHSIEVVFAPYLRVTTSAVNGYISGGSSRLTKGSNFDVTFSPRDGYALSSVTVNGEEQNITDGMNSYTVSNIQEDTQVEVVFTKIYNITTSCVNGTITESQTGIFEGEERTITFEGNPGTVLRRVLIDGEEADSPTDLEAITLVDIREDHIIEVVYEPLGMAVVHYVDTDGNVLGETNSKTGFGGTRIGVIEGVGNSISEICSHGWQVVERPNYLSDEFIMGDTVDYYITFEPIIETIEPDSAISYPTEMNSDGTLYPGGLSDADLNTEFVRNISYVYETGETAAEDKSDTVAFTRVGYVNHVTSEVWYDDWETIESYPEVSSPKISNYTPDIMEVPENTPAFTDGNFEITVTYYENDKQIANIFFVDEEGNMIAEKETVTGHPGEDIIFTVVEDTVNQLGNNGWLVVQNDYDDAAGDTFDNDYSVNQDYYVVCTPLIITYTYDEPGVPGEPANPDYPNGPKVPNGVTSDDLHFINDLTILYIKKDIENEITEINEDTYIADPVNASVDIYTTITVNYVTGEITNNGYDPEKAEFGIFESPEVTGYYPDRTSIDAYELIDVIPENTHYEEIVMYEPVPTTITIVFMLGENELNNISFTGLFGYSYNVTIDEYIEDILGVTDRRFLVSNEYPGSETLFDIENHTYLVIFDEEPLPPPIEPPVPTETPIPTPTNTPEPTPTVTPTATPTPTVTPVPETSAVVSTGEKLNTGAIIGGITLVTAGAICIYIRFVLNKKKDKS